MAYRKKGKTFTCILLVCICFLLMLACIVLLTSCGKKADDTDTSSQTESGSAQTVSQAIHEETVEWDGETYVYNDNLTNILFLGIDTTDLLDTTYTPGEAGQSDCIIILSLDAESGQARILQINRNTMMDIDVYNMAGRIVETVYAQICLQYAYCTGGTNSCWAAKNKVSDLMYGLELAGYFTLEIAGVAELNDAVGGVDVTLPQDYTEIDPSFTEGATVHLDGEKAEAFIRYRDTEVFDSVTDRMERQVIYITALIGQMKASGKDAVYDLIAPYLDTYILTDLTAEELNSLASYEYLTDDVRYLPGETVQGEEYEEYYADEDALQALIIELFYKQTEEE